MSVQRLEQRTEGVALEPRAVEEKIFDPITAAAEEFPAGGINVLHSDPRVQNYCLMTRIVTGMAARLTLIVIGSFTDPDTGVAEVVHRPEDPVFSGLSRTTFYRGVKSLEALGLVETLRVRDASGREHRRFILRHGIVGGWTPPPPDLANTQGDRLVDSLARAKIVLEAKIEKLLEIMGLQKGGDQEFVPGAATAQEEILAKVSPTMEIGKIPAAVWARVALGTASRHTEPMGSLVAERHAEGNAMSAGSAEPSPREVSAQVPDGNGGLISMGEFQDLVAKTLITYQAVHGWRQRGSALHYYGKNPERFYLDLEIWCKALKKKGRERYESSARYPVNRHHSAEYSARLEQNRRRAAGRLSGLAAGQTP